MSQSFVTMLALIINVIVLVAVIVGTIIFIKKIKFTDKNNGLLFVLYMIYWISPLLCRDYTACIHIHLHIGDEGLLLWIPIVSYGIMTLFWRPLNDILTYRLKSRKTVIFISLAVQLFCIIPFLVFPTFTTNIIQSIGAGVGAAGIGLFNLMFNEKEDRKTKKFLTVSLFALPPIISGILVAPFETVIASFVPDIHTSYQYISIIWFIFFGALGAIIACVIITSFITEKKEKLYQYDNYKTPIKSKKEIISFILICFCGACALFVRWATAGETATIQLAYIAINDGTFTYSTSMIEGYLGLLYSVGALVGTVIGGIWLNKTKNQNRTQMLLMALATGTSIIYLGLTSSFVNTYTFFFLNLLNGLSYGLLWNVLIGITLDKVFVNVDNKITPIGIFNASLSLGAIFGSLLVGFWKGEIFDLHGGWKDYTYQDFKLANFFVAIICIVIIGSMMIAYIVSHFLYKDHESQRIKVSKQFVNQTDTDM